ncbi:hypothetical protein P4740_15485, partial [Listeria monocytogenes]|nr:hypothetical protein [Listeria monocytogenes]
HIYGNYDAVDKNKITYHLKTLAYGGKKMVYTKEGWNIFRHTLEKHIFQTKQLKLCTTNNCTEGGARIEGTIEKPFKEICETLL